jgi:hypothetical protein
MSIRAMVILRRKNASIVVVLLTSLIAAVGRAQAIIPVYDLREELRIVSNDSIPGMLLTGVEDVAVLPDGRIITVHPNEAVVRVFDRSGRLLKVIGRRGGGPGEFRIPQKAGYVGDKVWVGDVGRPYQLFHSRTYEPVGEVAAGPTSGFFWGLASDSTSFHSGGRDDSTSVSIYDRTGQRRVPVDLTLRSAGHQFEIQWQEITPAGRTGRMVPHTMSSPLRALTHLALAPGGQDAFVLEPSELWNGPPGQFTIRRIETATGRISAPVTVSLAVRRVTSSDADSIIRQLTPLIRGRASWDPGLADQYLEKAKAPATYPALSSFIASADGVLWLAQHANPGMRLVVDTAGKPLMHVRLPKGLRVMVVSRTHVWGVTLDTDDLPIIVRYRVLN